MKKQKHKKGLHWTTVWLFSVLALTSIVFVTFAAYTEVSSVKRVVSTTSAPAELFSSNCLRKDISSRRLTTTEYTITVCNFDQEKPTTYNPSQITYTLSAKLQIKVGDDYQDLSTYISGLSAEKQREYIAKAAKYSIAKTMDDAGNSFLTETETFTSENNFTVSFLVDTLEASKSSIDKYKVGIDPADLESMDTEFFVLVWATPTSPSNLKKIESRLYASKTVADTASWTGTFLETDCSTVDYDFYNYIISGSGAGTVDILWDSDKFEINEFFFTSELSGVTFVGVLETISEENTIYPSYKGWKKVTIKVDSLTKNRYELQLYKTQAGASYTGDNAATNYIHCEFKK